MRAPVIVALMCVLVVPVVLAHGGETSGAIEAQLFHGTGTVSPGGFAEVDFEVRTNDTIEWSVESSKPVNVNIHQHQHVKTATFAHHNETRSASGTFVAPEDGTYSLMVVGVSQEDADVEVEMDGTFGLVGVIGLSEEEESPVVALPLVVLTGLTVAAAFRRR